ncbi:MAG: rubredoxin [Faecalibacterium sp.]
MQTWKCSICGYLHQEAKDGLFADLPSDWVCPLCKAEKSAFVAEGAPSAEKSVDYSLLPTEEKELSPLELSAICSNLAKGCEKQYLATEAELFTQLANGLKRSAIAPYCAEMDALLAFVAQDLAEPFPLIEAIASDKQDRGALRAYTWSLKVTTLLQGLLTRYQEVGDAMLENTGVYVCTICGFIYVGNELPDLCPVCKVPNYKFEAVEGK